MKWQKGQGLVEFALILPLFLLLFFGVIHFSLMFLDMQTLNSVVREAGREAAEVQIDPATKEPNYAKIEAKVKSAFEDEASGYKLYSSVFAFKLDKGAKGYAHDNCDGEYFTIKSDEESKKNNIVIVKLHADYDTENSNIAKVIQALSGNDNEKSGYDIVYHVYRNFSQ